MLNELAEAMKALDGKKRISEEPAEVVEANSNKMHDNGAMTDGSKRRPEAVESASDGESASSVMGSYSFISDTGGSPPLFPAVHSGLPATHKPSTRSGFQCATACMDQGYIPLVMHASQDGPFCREAHHLP